MVSQLDFNWTPTALPIFNALKLGRIALPSIIYDALAIDQFL
ncbi:hypothetical protein [Brumimicrobium glaciale]|nr:hypothetical protein [Brumimicrobium glaciale]